MHRIVYVCVAHLLSFAFKTLGFQVATLRRLGNAVATQARLLFLGVAENLLSVPPQVQQTKCTGARGSLQVIHAIHRELVPLIETVVS